MATPSSFKKGNIPWNKNKKGIHLSPKSEFKAGESTGISNVNWKGDEVGYRALHYWIERRKGKPNKCSHCGKIGTGRQIHWANKSHDYKRKLSDWLRLCAECHGAYDSNKMAII